jgi:predicted Zn-dependent protease
MQHYFHEIADRLKGLLLGDEVFTAYLAAEDSDFCRFNHARVRQVGVVSQKWLTLTLIKSKRQVQSEVMLSGVPTIDQERLRALIGWMRGVITELPEDPYIQYATKPVNTEHIRPNHLPPAQMMVEEVVRLGEGLDLVGFLSSGGVYRGFANSLGQRNWYESYSFNFSWSSYLEADKAAKSSYAGFVWREAELEEKLSESRQALQVLARPQRSLKPGKYRAFIAPSAMNEVTELLGWGSFGVKAQRTMQSPLIKLAQGERHLSPQINICENTDQGVAPNFDMAGFIRPDRVDLITDGKFAGALISPRSAQEFSLPVGGANAQEAPESLEIAGGKLPHDRILKELDTGLYINNLWYLNYSDHNACRMTGMTRFASFWVERGEVVASIPVMRFDESIYDMLGKNLIALTADQEMILGSSTYTQRSTSSHRLPGALVSEFNLTL